LWSLPRRPRHSFPTRRSSDLMEAPYGNGTKHQVVILGQPVAFTRTSHDLFAVDVELPKHEPVRVFYLHSTRVNAASISASDGGRSEEHTSELQSPDHLVCGLL